MQSQLQVSRDSDKIQSTLDKYSDTIYQLKVELKASKYLNQDYERVIEKLLHLVKDAEERQIITEEILNNHRKKSNKSDSNIEKDAINLYNRMSKLDSLIKKTFGDDPSRYPDLQ